MKKTTIFFAILCCFMFTACSSKISDKKQNDIKSYIETTIMNSDASFDKIDSDINVRASDGKVYFSVNIIDDNTDFNYAPYIKEISSAFITKLQDTNLEISYFIIEIDFDKYNWIFLSTDAKNGSVRASIDEVEVYRDSSVNINDLSKYFEIPDESIDNSNSSSDYVLPDITKDNLEQYVAIIKCDEMQDYTYIDKNKKEVTGTLADFHLLALKELTYPETLAIAYALEEDYAEISVRFFTSYSQELSSTENLKKQAERIQIQNKQVVELEVTTAKVKYYTINEYLELKGDGIAVTPEGLPDTDSDSTEPLTELASESNIDTTTEIAIDVNAEAVANSSNIDSPAEEVVDSVEYIGNSSTKKFHRINCSEVKRINQSNKVNLSSRDSATSSGYIACKKCNP